MPALDSLLGFTDPATCATSEPHTRFLDAMVVGDANEGFRAGRLLVPGALLSAFGPIKVVRHDGWWTVGVAVRGTLFDLPVSRIDHALPEGGDPGDVTYEFAAPVERVEQVLRARGFPARAGKDVTLGPPDGYEHIMSLQAHPDDARLSQFGCGYS